MHHKWTQPKRGFTVVELIVTIVVISILAAVTTIVYTGIQKQAADSTMRSDLSSGARIMEVDRRKLGAYPVITPAELRNSPDVTFKLVAVEGPPRYEISTLTQRGVLFHTLCQGLIAEGYGTGTNRGGGVEQYITGCNVYNHDSIQINGWQSHNFDTPVTSSTIAARIANVPPGDAWRPDQQAVIRGFYTELGNRFLQSGGSYPVNNFRDPWASPKNSGIPIEPLPTPSAPGPDGRTYCLEARHARYKDLVASIRSTEPTVKQISCDP